jgi:hypothetical protein
MVRRGSTVRVRQRALQKPRKSGFLRSGRLAPRRMCSGYGAVYGAFSFRTAWGSRQLWQHERRGPFRETWRRTTSVAPDRGRSRVALDRVGAASALAPANRAAPFRGDARRASGGWARGGGRARGRRHTRGSPAGPRRDAMRRRGGLCANRTPSACADRGCRASGTRARGAPPRGRGPTRSADEPRAGTSARQRRVLGRWT